MAKVDKLHHLSLPHFPRKELLKKSLLEDLQSQRHTSQGPNISPLYKPCVSNVLEFTSVLLGLLICGKPHSEKYLIDFIDEFMEVFLNHRPI